MFWNKIKMYWQWVALALFLVSLVFGFTVLYLASQAADRLEPITTPWYILQFTRYIYVFAAATFLIGVLIVFSTFRTKLLLLFLVLYSFLLHSYLPLTHPLLYGADQWRHIASEAQLMDGHWPSKPVVRQLDSPKGAPVELTTLGMINKFEIGDLAYSGFWILSAGIAKISTLDLIAINKWLVPIVWSIAFPILLYAIARVLQWSEKKSLFTVWLASLPFAFQAAGSFTLPVNLGFSVWLVGVLLILRRLKNPQPKQLVWLILFGILSIFNYTLFFVLFWVGWGMAEVLLLSSRKATAERRGDLQGLLRRPISLLAMTVVLGLSLPLLELIAGYSHFGPVNFLGQIKQLIGNFLGVYIVFGPRPHDIATGNIIFNQTPSYAFVENLFTIIRWWIIPFLIVFWSMVKYGWWQLVKKDIASKWMAILGASLFISYIFSRYFMRGEEVLARRLDVVLALFAIIFFSYGIGLMYAEIQKYRNTEIQGRNISVFPYFVISVFLVVYSIAISASYSLGPDTKAVGEREYTAMQYVWNEEKDKTNHCVIADTYPLLALEAISKKAIVGGGFPIDKDFGQPELVQTYTTIAGTDNNIANEKKVLHDALEITHTDYCTFVGQWGYIVTMNKDFNFTSDWPATAP